MTTEPAPAADVRIVPTATSEHLAGYHRCLDLIARERRWFGIVEGPPLAACVERVRRLLANGGVHVSAVDAAGEVVGWCDIERHEREGFRHGGRLGMGLLPAHRGHGLGARLMTAAIEQARALGMERVELEVYASNGRAIALYRRLGFVDEGVRRRARKLDGAYDDDILMALSLDTPDAGAQVREARRAPAVLVVTGASGAGKTTLVRALTDRGVEGVGCYHFDAIGVPSEADMAARFDGPGGWQAWAAERWVERLARNDDGVEVAVLDGQLAPAMALAACRRAGLSPARAILLDCAPHARQERLTGPRGQPELASPRMDTWAAYLRGQADALGVPVLDTTDRAPAELVDALLAEVRALSDRARAAHG